MSDNQNGPDRAALPSKSARLLALGGILLAGLCGGLAGYAFGDLQCTGNCSTQAALWALLGAVVAAAGVAIVATLVLKAMEEWHTTKGDTTKGNSNGATNLHSSNAKGDKGGKSGESGNDRDRNGPEQDF